MKCNAIKFEREEPGQIYDLCSFYCQVSNDFIGVPADLLPENTAFESDEVLFFQCWITSRNVQNAALYSQLNATELSRADGAAPKYQKLRGWEAHSRYLEAFDGQLNFL